jgi:hypothetical protein
MQAALRLWAGGEWIRHVDDAQKACAPTLWTMRARSALERLSC